MTTRYEYRAHNYTCVMCLTSALTMALLRLERTMNFLCHWREGRGGGGSGGREEGREGGRVGGGGSEGCLLYIF